MQVPPGVFRMHLEERLFPGAAERYVLASIVDPEGDMARALSAEDQRRTRVMSALNAFIKRQPDDPLRQALTMIALGAKAVFTNRGVVIDGAAFAFREVDIASGFYFLLNPRFLADGCANDVGEMAQRHGELFKLLVAS